eukprot:CAMPEP_0170732764 /NCGR_PEP_ID=MMETSP0437-20130122/1725_1 /TAXON_ID=0 /ORGANISM="Sexangularia sp." /LENGTH=554 /DNA_ID=CAMNT_0011071021 /DNA_START=64 /DNA_END=1728 /DNA_ORIENTATION=-
MGCGSSKPAKQSTSDGLPKPKTAEDRKKKSKLPSSVTARFFDDLPDRVQRDLERTNIPFGEFDRQLHVLSNVLRFSHKMTVVLDVNEEHPCWESMQDLLAQGCTFDLQKISAQDADAAERIASQAGTAKDSDEEEDEPAGTADTRETGGTVGMGKSPVRRSARSSKPGSLNASGHKSRSRSRNSSNDTTPRKKRSRATSVGSPGKADAPQSPGSSLDKIESTTLMSSAIDKARYESVDLKVLGRYDPFLRAKGEEHAASISPSEYGTFAKRFNVGDVVGSGGFGKVFETQVSGKDKQLAGKSTVALKKMLHSSASQENTNFNEIGCLLTFSHTNIVKFITAFVVHPPEKKPQCWVVMELMKGGTLQEAAKVASFTDEHCAYVGREMLKGIAYIHDLGYAHRDLKSANVMMSLDAEIKLIDFGLCTRADSHNLRHMVGSPFWMPPEMIRRQPHGLKVDLWSLAISLWEMRLSKAPNSHNKVRALFLVATEGLKPPKAAGEAFQEFLGQCLKLKPSDRPDAKDLLNHPFLDTAVDVEAISAILRDAFMKKALSSFS